MRKASSKQVNIADINDGQVQRNKIAETVNVNLGLWPSLEQVEWGAAS